MSQPRSAVADYGVYLVVRILVCVLQALPFRLALDVADFLARIVYRVNRRHREVALDNLRQAFPGQCSEAELHARVKAVYRHFCRLAVEMMHLPRLIHPTNWRTFINYANPEDMPRVYRALLSGRPVLLLTGHFGNWEMAGYLIGALGFRIASIARPIDNPYIDQFLRSFREQRRQKILTKKGEMGRIEEVLSQGGLVGTLADQDAGPRGPFVSFFGRPASTHKAIALLALEHRALILVAGAARVAEPCFYHALVEDIIAPEDYAGRPDAVRAITQRFTTALERLVRRYPDQYFWLHRRWKHQPAIPRRRAA